MLTGISLRLVSQHKIDLKTPLTDADRFPRADIDVYAVWHVRVEILKLRDDHQKTMKKTESALQDVLRTGATFDPLAGAVCKGRRGSRPRGKPGRGRRSGQRIASAYRPRLLAETQFMKT
ncbi:hypothetical protein BDZ88DRAFT_455135 [Geranomyces variabilis]|nr:hypothetical protein BDZ88DRAFT_455135 [Geranomyces variabilis]KAJ3132205.1 hypothetical protein HDU90_007511 [Geranomyces variabilis]